MPDGTIATIATTARRPRAKKAMTEVEFIALCESAIQAEKAWSRFLDIMPAKESETPPAMLAEQERLFAEAQRLLQKVVENKATRPITLSAKARAIAATFCERIDQFPELQSLLEDAAALRMSEAPTAADREIIRLVDEFKKHEAKGDELEVVVNAYPSKHAKARAAEKKISRLIDREWEIRLRVAELAATSMEALAAKAWLSVWETCDGATNEEPVCDEKRVPWSLAKDVQRALATGTFQTGTAAARDADLIALGQEYAALKAASDAQFEAAEKVGFDSAEMRAFDADDPPRQDRMNAIETMVSEMRPVTMAGFAAKALITLRQLMLFHSTRDDGVDGSVVTAVALCHDLMAQAGREGQAVAKSVPQPDASVIAICADYIAAMDAWNSDRSEGSEQDNPVYHRFLSATDAYLSSRATTLAGFVAKAHVLLHDATRPDGTEDPEDVADWTWGLVKELVRLGPTPSATALSTSTAAANPDASLIALCAEHMANYQAFNTYEGELAAENNPLWQSYMATYDRLRAAKPQTLAGFAAKARVIKAEVTHADGVVGVDDESDLIMDLVKDLAGFAPAAPPSVSEVARLALEMGRLDREAAEADGLKTDEANGRVDELGAQISATARSIMKMAPETPEDVMGKLIATIGSVHSITARLEDSAEDRELGVAVRRSLEDCVLTLSKLTGRPATDMGGDYFMGRRLREIAQ